MYAGGGDRLVSVKDHCVGEAQQPCQQIVMAARKSVVSLSGRSSRSHQGPIIRLGGSEGEGLCLGDVVVDDPFEGHGFGGGDGD